MRAPKKSRFRTARLKLLTRAGAYFLSVAVAVLLVLALTGWAEKRSAGEAWARVPHDQMVFGGDRAMNSIIAGGPGLVAVGSDGYHAAVWLSSDGRSWTRVPRNKKVFGGKGEQVMNSVATGGPGLVAVGSDSSTGDADAAVWLSRDGSSWTRVPRNKKVFGGKGTQKMYSVTARRSGLVAVGYDDPEDNSEGNAAVWLSKNGRSWTRVPDDEKVFGGKYAQEMSSVTTGGPGLVAVGDDGGCAAVWLSKNDRSWTRVPHNKKIFCGAWDRAMVSVTASTPGLVAVGYNKTGGLDSEAAVWLSKDGRSWKRVFSGGGIHQFMSSVTTGGPGLVAVGDDSYGGQDSNAAVWLSEDGRSWRGVPYDESVFGGDGDGSQSMMSVTAGGPGLVAVGSDDYKAAVWFSPPGSG